jgi:hypothetical protein
LIEINAPNGAGDYRIHTNEYEIGVRRRSPAHGNGDRR